jgi:WD40 repeat protein
MTDDPRRLLIEIDAVCERFEQALRESGTPRIEEYLSGWAGERRDQLFQHLLELEIDYRRSGGREPTSAAEYQSRFPEHSKLIATVCGAPVSAPGIGRRIGDYEIIREIGRGGMGVVYEARQSSLNRTVALKVLPQHASENPQALGRFRREARAAAKLHHTNIVPVYEVGEAGGTIFYAMQYIDARSLDMARPCVDGDSGGRHWREIARIGQQVAAALQYAHERGVIHRDIKPSNLLLDGAGIVWVADFGLAKTEDDGLTRTGDVLGTIRYMSPERFTGRCDERADIYGLGASLYELLTARPAFAAEDRLQLVEQIATHEPALPHALDPRIPRDFETIVLKTLEKDPASRYQRAGDLADDLGRWLADLPISARRPTVWEQLARWRRRSPGIATALAVIVFLLGALAVGGSVAAVRFRNLAADREKARQREAAARRASDDMLVELHTASGLQAARAGEQAQAALWFANAGRLAGDGSARQQVELLRARAWGKGAISPIAALGRHVLDGPFQRLEIHPSGRYLILETAGAAAPIDRLHATVWRVGDNVPLDFPGLPGATSAAWSDGGHRVAIGKPGGIAVYDFPSGVTVGLAACAGDARRATFSPDGRFLAFADDAGARVWSCVAREFATDVFQHPAPVDALAFSPRGEQLATSSRDRNARVFDVAPHVRAPRFAPAPHLAWSPGAYGAKSLAPLFLDGGQRLLTLTPTELVWWDTATGARIKSAVHAVDRPLAAASSSDGGLIAVAGGPSSQGLAQVYDTRTGKAVGPLLRQTNAIASAAFSPDARMLVTGSTDRSMRVWSIPECKPIAPAVAHPASVYAVGFGPNGLLASGQDGGEVRIWALPGRTASLVPLATANSFVRQSADGQYAIAAGMNYMDCRLERTQVFEVATGRPAGAVIAPGGTILGTAFAPDGRQLALLTGGVGGQPGLHLVDWKKGKSVGGPLVLPSEPRWLDYRGDGGALAVICSGGELLAIDPATCRTMKQWQARPPQFNASHYIFGNGAVRFSPDGRQVVTWGTEPEARVFDSRTGQPRYALKHDRECHSVRYSPDGRLIVTGSLDNTMRVWDATDGHAIGDLVAHPDWVFDTVFSPDGRLIATSCRDFTARVWDWRKRELVCPPLAHRDEVHPVAFTPDGRWVVTASLDGTAAVWDWRTGKPVLPPIPLPGKALDLAITPDGRHLLVGGFVTSITNVSLADLDTAGLPDFASACTWAELLSGQRLDAGGVLNLTADEWLGRWRRVRSPGVDLRSATTN